MARNLLERFEQWRSKLPGNTAFLVDLVLDEIVPMFEAQGLRRHPDYAHKRTDAVASYTIALQRREGSDWPTVQISFDKSQRPNCYVTFSVLPEVCRRITPKGEFDIPRIEANVVEGDAYFRLCKGGRQTFDSNFGYVHFSLFPRRRIRAEIDQLKALLPMLFQLFDDGIPAEWVGKRGQVSPYVFANPGARYAAHPAGSGPAPH